MLNGHVQNWLADSNGKHSGLPNCKYEEQLLHNGHPFLERQRHQWSFMGPIRSELAH